MRYKCSFVINKFWTDVIFTLQYGLKKIMHNVNRIKPYTSDTDVEDINSKTNH